MQEIYDKFFTKLLLALRSRTVWTVIIIFLVNGIESVKTMIPPEYLPLVDGLLALAAIYFRLNPKAK